MNDYNSNKKTGKALIPSLRFPEFQNSGEWEWKRIGDILEYERPDKYIVTSDNYVSEGIPVLTANKSFILGYTQETFGICNDIPAIIFDDFTVDKKFVDFPFKVKSSAIKILRPSEKEDLKFLYELMSLIRFEAKEHKRYYISAYQNLSVPIPKPNEQQKIASCLSSIDEVIAGERQRLELLNAHKKGLLQNLFPREGETVPKLRFPEFKDSGEWEEKKLGEVFESFSGGTPNTTNKEYYNGEIPFIRSAEIGKEKTELFISDLGLKESSAKLVNKGDLLVALYGANSGDVSLSKISGAINQAILCMRSEYSNEFAYHYLTLKKNWIVARYIQGGQGNLSGDIIKSIELSFPGKEEQQKIASCLSSLDDLIQAQQQKIELLEQHKKGLLQALFPNANAIANG
ncbi:MAG TPA: restriction endonuclease subunit S [Bacteroidia bacterium]|nr:restriction endonuclease subunit S [Bacteroidia bacterium]